MRGQTGHTAVRVRGGGGESYQTGEMIEKEIFPQKAYQSE